MSALSKNFGYSTLTKIDKIINSEISEFKDDELSVENLLCFEYAPNASCDAVRSFFKY